MSNLLLYFESQTHFSPTLGQDCSFHHSLGSLTKLQTVTLMPKSSSYFKNASLHQPHSAASWWAGKVPPCFCFFFPLIPETSSHIQTSPLKCITQVNHPQLLCDASVLVERSYFGTYSSARVPSGVWSPRLRFLSFTAQSLQWAHIPLRLAPQVCVSIPVILFV